MRVAYLTTDEVHELLAQAMAAPFGIWLVPLAPKQAPPDEDFDAVVCDWDLLPPEVRRVVREEPLANPEPRPAVGHAYNLGGKKLEAWRQEGVTAFRRKQ
jgi:hypothetical protein